MTNSRILQLMLGKCIGNVAIKKIFAFLDDNRCSIEDAFASKTVFAQEIGLRESVVESIYSMKEKADRIAEDLNQEGVISANLDLKFETDSYRTTAIPIINNISTEELEELDTLCRTIQYQNLCEGVDLLGKK